MNLLRGEEKVLRLAWDPSRTDSEVIQLLEQVGEKQLVKGRLTCVGQGRQTSGQSRRDLGQELGQGQK